jgi:hypothetical protein
MPYRCECRDTRGVVLALALLVFITTILVFAQPEAPRRVSHAAAGMPMVPPTGWHQGRPGHDDPFVTRPLSAAARRAFLEKTANTPEALFLFAKKSYRGHREC